jgi:hypothetical protein
MVGVKVVVESGVVGGGVVNSIIDGRWSSKLAVRSEMVDELYFFRPSVIGHRSSIIRLKFNILKALC